MELVDKAVSQSTGKTVRVTLENGKKLSMVIVNSTPRDSFKANLITGNETVRVRVTTFGQQQTVLEFDWSEQPAAALTH